MIVANCDQVPGKETEEIVGLARGSSVQISGTGEGERGEEALDFGSFKMTESREEALRKMKKDADCLDADGVVNVVFEVEEIENGGFEVLAYGTAVKFAK